MFNKIFKFLKNPILSTNKKQKIRIFLRKDLKQYKVEYLDIITSMVGKAWSLGNKSIDVKTLKLIKTFKLVFQVIFLYYVFFIILN